MCENELSIFLVFSKLFFCYANYKVCSVFLWLGFISTFSSMRREKGDYKEMKPRGL